MTLFQESTQAEEPALGATLKRFARPRPAVTVCELCSAELPERHEHLVEPAKRQLLCACQACAVLFGHAASGNYRRVPRRVRALDGFEIGDLEWRSLGVPIGLAFFSNSSAAGGIVAAYPSPAGPTEAPLEREAWDELAAEHPVLQRLQPDVEALLVNRMQGHADYLLAPIDQCYRLVGLVRRHWRGLWGGAEAWQHIDEFFAELKGRAD